MRTSPFNYYGKARYEPGVMNKTESSYAEHLSAMKSLGLIKDYFFECIKLKINKACHYNRRDTKSHLLFILKSEMTVIHCYVEVIANCYGYGCRTLYRRSQ